MNETLPFNPKFNRIAFWVLRAAFSFNHTVLRSVRMEYKLWQLIKIELFYITGACQHSGNCCRNLMVFNNGTPLSKPHDFHAAKTKLPQVFNRFFPVSETSDGTITAYDCHCLTPQNHCDDYQNRPQFCHNYPASAFLSTGRLLQGCGFSISMKPKAPKITHPRLKTLVQTMD